MLRQIVSLLHLLGDHVSEVMVDEEVSNVAIITMGRTAWESDNIFSVSMTYSV